MLSTVQRAIEMCGRARVTKNKQTNIINNNNKAQPYKTQNFCQSPGLLAQEPC
jgi:hypothetical protein